MSFELAVSNEATEDLHALIDSLPSSRRRDAFDGVEAALEKLVANPLLASRQHLGRPTYYFQFTAGNIHYHWGCTFVYSEDEKTIQITHIFRVAL